MVILFTVTLGWSNRPFIHERASADAFLDRDEALGAENEIFDTLSVEDVSRVATELDNFIISFLVVLRHSLAIIAELVFKAIGLVLQVSEGFLASFAVVRLIVHQILNSTNHDRILELALADGLEDQLNEASHREALLHLLSGMDNTAPE